MPTKVGNGGYSQEAYDPNTGKYTDRGNISNQEEKIMSTLGLTPKFNGLKSKNNLGQELSPGQEEYFKDSKMRDENGNLKVFYHGTPNGTFVSFKPHSYFTENEEYARNYTSPGASSISSYTSKKVDNPTVHAVYLNIKKPFDINDPEAKRIYYDEFIKGGYSNFYDPYTPKSMINNLRGIDWLEGVNLFEFLTEEHPEYGYDGLVLDEGATGGYGFETKDRGLSWVNFYPNQVKKITNLNPTDSDNMYDKEEETQAMKLLNMEDY